MKRSRKAKAINGDVAGRSPFASQGNRWQQRLRLAGAVLAAALLQSAICADFASAGAGFFPGEQLYDKAGARRAIRKHFFSPQERFGSYTLVPYQIGALKRYRIYFQPLDGLDPLFATPDPLGNTSVNSTFGFDILAEPNIITVGASETGILGPYHAFKWRASTGTTSDLGTLAPAADDPGTLSFAFGIGADGTIVGGSYLDDSNSVEHAFRIRPGGSMVDLGSLLGPSGNSFATAVNGNGAVVAGVTEVVGSFGPVRHAFRWDKTGLDTGTMADLGGFGLGSAAVAVSLNGSIVVGGADKSVVIGGVNTNRTHATLWKTPATPRPISACFPATPPRSRLTSAMMEQSSSAYPIRPG